MSTAIAKPWTADELVRLPPGWRYEIDEGALVIMSPAGRRHARIVAEVARRLGNFVHDHRFGEVVGGEFGVYLQREPETLRGIDVAVYSAGRIERMGDEDGFPDVPPDLAVEVHLPDERDMQRKVRQYLAAGVRSVWVIDPAAGTLVQYRPDGQAVRVAGLDDTVREPVLPGFSCRLRDLLGRA